MTVRPGAPATPVERRRLAVFSLPMKVRFRRVDHREGVLVFGAAGAGEFSPFWEYGVEESATWLAAALEAADLGFPEPVRDSVPVNCTIPAVGPAQAAALAGGPHGCTTAKVKVAEPGQTLVHDLERVEAVRAAMGPSARIRIDANGAWSVDQAVRAIRQLSRFDLEYVEQPSATVEELADVRRRVDVPIAADESIRRADDPSRVRSLDAADIAVLKVQPLGGVRACLRLAEDIGLPVVVSSALESSVGIAAGVALAAALPQLPYACGLATTAMFDADVVATSLSPVDGHLPVGPVAPEPGPLTAVRADPETEARWRERLAACATALTERPSMGEEQRR